MKTTAFLLVLLSLLVERREAQTTGNVTSCPVVKDGALGFCGEECVSDSECSAGWRCCPNTCGKQSCQQLAKQQNQMEKRKTGQPRNFLS